MTLILPKKKDSLKIITKHDYLDEHQRWCLENNIKIYYRAIDFNYGRITICEKGEIKVGNKTYINDTKKIKGKQENWSNQIEILYTTLYFKYNEKK
jgi:hypothetical protein